MKRVAIALMLSLFAPLRAVAANDVHDAHFQWKYNLVGTDGRSVTGCEVHRPGPLFPELKVKYRLADGTAKRGIDYVGKQGVILFADGQSTAALTGLDIRGGVGKYFFVELQPFVKYHNYELGQQPDYAGTRITIIGAYCDDHSTTVSFQSQESAVIAPAREWIPLMLTRSGNVSGETTVMLMSMDGDAKSWEHYTPIYQPVRFRDRERSVLINAPMPGGSAGYGTGKIYVLHIFSGGCVGIGGINMKVINITDPIGSE